MIGPGVVADVDVEADGVEAGREPGDLGADLGATGEADEGAAGASIIRIRTVAPRQRPKGRRHGGRSMSPAQALPGRRECAVTYPRRPIGQTALAEPASMGGDEVVACPLRVAGRGRSRSWPTRSPAGSAGRRPSCSACPAAACRWPPPSPPGSTPRSTSCPCARSGRPATSSWRSGPIASGGLVVRNDDLIARLELDEGDVAATHRRSPAASWPTGTGACEATGHRRRSPARVVVLVDDGLATGATMRAAIGAVRTAAAGAGRRGRAGRPAGHRGRAGGDRRRRHLPAPAGRLRRRRRVVPGLPRDHRRRRRRAARSR